MKSISERREDRAEHLDDIKVTMEFPIDGDIRLLNVLHKLVELCQMQEQEINEIMRWSHDHAI